MSENCFACFSTVVNEQGVVSARSRVGKISSRALSEKLKHYRGLVLASSFSRSNRVFEHRSSVRPMIDTVESVTAVRTYLQHPYIFSLLSRTVRFFAFFSVLLLASLLPCFLYVIWSPACLVLRYFAPSNYLLSLSCFTAQQLGFILFISPTDSIAPALERKLQRAPDRRLRFPTPDVLLQHGLDNRHRQPRQALVGAHGLQALVRGGRVGPSGGGEI